MTVLTDDELSGPVISSRFIAQVFLHRRNVAGFTLFELFCY